VAKRHREILARLEPIGVRRYRITEKDVREVEQYLGIIQKGVKGGSTWQEVVQYGGPYGTSIIIHEVVQIAQLRGKGINPLKLRTRALRRAVSLNMEAHAIATHEEHFYLQEVIERLFGQRFEVATLIRANRGDETDLELFLESGVGVYRLEEERIEEAAQVIERLKREE
jgi:hypothetical protein